MSTVEDLYTDLQPEWLQNKVAGQKPDKNIQFSTGQGKSKSTRFTEQERSAEQNYSKLDSEMFFDKPSGNNEPSIHQNEFRSKFYTPSGRKQQSYNLQSNKDGNLDLFNRRRSLRYEQDDKSWQKKDNGPDAEDFARSKFQTRESKNNQYNGMRNHYYNNNRSAQNEKAGNLFGFSKKSSMEATNRSKDWGSNKQWADKKDQKDEDKTLQEDFSIPPIQSSKPRFSSGLGFRPRQKYTQMKHYNRKEMYDILEEMLVKYGSNMPKLEGIQGEGIEVLLKDDKEKAKGIEIHHDRQQSSTRPGYQIKINNLAIDQRRPLYKPPSYYKQQQQKEEAEKECKQQNIQDGFSPKRDGLEQDSLKLENHGFGIHKDIQGLSLRDHVKEEIRGGAIISYEDKADVTNQVLNEMMVEQQEADQSLINENTVEDQAESTPMQYKDYRKQNLSDEAIKIDLWMYLDPQGTVQGPFKSQQIVMWHDEGFFSSDLLVKSMLNVGDNQAVFQPLQDYFSIWRNPRSAQVQFTPQGGSETHTNQTDTDNYSMQAQYNSAGVHNKSQNEELKQNMLGLFKDQANEQPWDSLNAQNKAVQDRLQENKAEVDDHSIQGPTYNPLSSSNLLGSFLMSNNKHPKDINFLHSNKQQGVDQGISQGVGQGFGELGLGSLTSSQQANATIEKGPFNFDFLGQSQPQNVGLGSAYQDSSHTLSQPYDLRSLHFSQAGQYSQPYNSLFGDTQYSQQQMSLPFVGVDRSDSASMSLNPQVILNQHMKAKQSASSYMSPPSNHYSIPESKQNQLASQPLSVEQFEAQFLNKQNANSQQNPGSQYGGVLSGNSPTGYSQYSHSHLEASQNLDNIPYQKPENENFYQQVSQHGGGNLSSSQQSSYHQQMSQGAWPEEHTQTTNAQATNSDKDKLSNLLSQFKSKKKSDLPTTGRISSELEKQKEMTKQKEEATEQKQSQIQTLADIEAKMGIKINLGSEIKKPQQSYEQLQQDQQLEKQNMKLNMEQTTQKQANNVQEVESGQAGAVQNFSEVKQNKKKKKGSKQKGSPKVQDNMASRVIEATTSDQLQQGGNEGGEWGDMDVDSTAVGEPKAMRQTAPAPWLQQLQQNSQGIEKSLADIQKEQQEAQKTAQQRQLEEHQRQLREQLQNMQAQEVKAQNVWGGSKIQQKNDNQPKSLADIQAEEQIKVEQQQLYQKQQQRQAQVLRQQQSQAKGGSVWGNQQKSTVTPVQAVQQQQRAQSLAQVQRSDNENHIQQLFANGIKGQGRSQQASMANQLAAQQRFIPQQKSQVTPQSQKLAAQKTTSQPANLYPAPSQPVQTEISEDVSQGPSTIPAENENSVIQGDFKIWCQQQIKGINGQTDITLLEVVVGIGSNGEVADILSEHLGKNDKVAQFTKEFLKKRDLQNTLAAKAQGQGVKASKKKPKQKSKADNDQGGGKNKKLTGAKKQSSAQLGYFGVLDSL